MENKPINPFTPIELESETKVAVKDGDEKKRENAKHYHVRYIVGSSTDKKFVDAGKDSVEAVEDRTMFVVPSIHRMKDSPFHFNSAQVETLCGNGCFEHSKELDRVDKCGEHELVEVAFESPGVECCAMSKEDADKYEVPLKYLAGYLLGKSNGYVKIALAKTVLESGSAFYDHIHIIPEPVVSEITCLA